ncbi:hypothetical protein ABZ816_01635 [Actinosynnema sp. NPDC047251]|uniref:Uncharacterized protein n=1 Tax=Saccharothrix espanaensis (strain ATCC 51144 / DSM 44229 / JCM 9112 / NBRC 15066 / NRRL 15764) TaxID=1179773 RepID=K0K305_SACES|nr:hypothetical protein [Saccharothrix espanaensis]CCH30953.1 hypothetical protein BN6_36580 [Saccharothrix espanaensis DSM 44229]
MPNWPQLSPVEQQQALAEITRAVIPTLPEGWQRLVLRADMIGRHTQAEAGVQMADKSVRGWEIPPEVWRSFQELRKGMYAEGLGSWVGFEYVVDPPFRYQIRYNRDERPAFQTPPTPDDFATENRWFPRTEENMTSWFREGLGDQAS